MSDQSTILMYQWFLELLGYFLKTYPLGDLVLLGTAFRLALPHKTTIRKLDLSLVLHSNPVPYLPFDKSYHGICDLCVEALSDSKPGELTRDTKFEEYAKVGVTEYSNIHLLWYF